MKLRENMYQLEYYRPQCDIGNHALTDQEKKIVHEIGVLINKAETRLKEGFKEIKVLLNELVGQLKDLVILYKNNYLLPRFVFENEKSLRKIYGKKGFENLLNTAYSDGRQFLIFKAAQSYLTSEYYDTARLLFKKILRLDRQNTAVLFLYMYSSAYYFYFKNMFTRSLMFAEKARDLNADENIQGIYTDSLKKLIFDLSKEIKKKKKQ
jgi:tetratricopeptide (TPR) repeat protein